MILVLLSDLVKLSDFALVADLVVGSLFLKVVHVEVKGHTFSVKV